MCERQTNLFVKYCLYLQICFLLRILYTAHLTLTVLTDVIGTDKLLVVSVQFVAVVAVMTLGAAPVTGGVFTGMRLTRPHLAVNLTSLTATILALVLQRRKHLSIKVASAAVLTCLWLAHRATRPGHFLGGATVEGWTGLGVTGHRAPLIHKHIIKYFYKMTKRGIKLQQEHF